MSIAQTCAERGWLPDCGDTGTAETRLTKGELHNPQGSHWLAALSAFRGTDQKPGRIPKDSLEALTTE